MVPQEVKWLADAFFLSHSDEYDLSSQEGCGKYTEAFVEEAQHKGFKRVGHLRKHGSQTQYNGHAVDAILYREAVGEFGLYQAIDLIGDAESDHARSNFGIDIPRYKDSDWMEKPDSASSEPVNVFPFYEALGGDSTARNLLGKVMLADWREAGRLEDAPHKAGNDRKVVIDDGFVVWTFRTLYDALYDVVVHKTDGVEAVNKSISKHRSEWRKELGLS